MAVDKKESIVKRKCTTPMGRVSFPCVWKAESFQGGPPKFTVTLLFEKNADLTALKKAAHYAAVEEHGPDKTKWPKKFKMPFRDGNEKPELDGYKDKIVVFASSKSKPGIIDQKKEKIVEEDGTFYAGCYARATLIAFAYDTAGNRGVSFSLQNIQKMKDGKSFAGKKNAEEEFDEVEDGSDDESNYDDEDSDSEDGDEIDLG